MFLECYVECVYTRVSNGTGQCNFSGHRDKENVLVPGQRDNGTSSKSYHGTGRDGILTGCPVPSRDVPRDKINNHFAHLCLFKIKKIFFSKLFFGGPFFGYFLAILSCGTSRDRGSCPEIFPAALVPGQRDSGTR